MWSFFLNPGLVRLTAISAIGFFLCLCGIFLVAGSSWLLIRQASISEALLSPARETEHAGDTPSPGASISLPTSSPSGIDIPTSTQAPKEGLAQAALSQDTLSVFTNTIIHANDPIRLVRKLNGGLEIPAQLDYQVNQYSLGDQEDFWVLNSDINQSKQIQATLHYITDHVYFWVEDGVRFSPDSMKSLIDTFESKIYPTNHRFFGSEWTPGVDADPRLFIIYASNLGNRVAGHYYPNDEYLPLVHPFSNTREMFYLNAARLGLAEPFAYSVLAHEHQHMIHWHLDRNEETWMNEGFANLAAFVNGYDVGGADFAYVRDPDLQLNYWSNYPENRLPHYGAAFLFLAYFLDRFGEQASQELVENPANGMSSVDLVLQKIGAADPANGDPISANDFFADWVVATILQDEKVGDGRYATTNYPDAPKSDPTEYIDDCPTASTNREVSQYGADYIRINCQGELTVKFEGRPQVNALPTGAHSGDFSFYSNHGDESAMTLTRQFDFTDQAGPLTLEYWTWYDLETDYDYVYLMASTDGENWKIITTPSGTAGDPTGNNQGWGYTGYSHAVALQDNQVSWIREEVDISQFAGETVWLRFEYITDAAVYAEGFLVDDITVPEIGYATGFEEDEGGWLADGFVRIGNLLPQEFRVSIILVGDETSVESFELDLNNRGLLQVNLDEKTDYAILVVSGTTRFTRQKAIYSFSILK